MGLRSTDWTADGQQFLFRPLMFTGSEVHRFVVGEGFEQVDLDVDLPSGQLVTLPRNAVDWSS